MNLSWQPYPSHIWSGMFMVFLGTMKNPSWISWQPLKYHKWFSWQPWQDHAGTFFMASMVPYMVLGYVSQERSTREGM